MFSRKIFSSSSKNRTGSSEKATTLAHRTSATSNRSTSISSHTTVAQDDTNLSSVTQTTTESRKDDHDLTLNPLGLSMLHDPYGPRRVDIIFIHGLGGSSRMTWCKDKIPDLFWPKEWLAQDSDVHHSARIFSYGYNSKLKSSQQSSVFGISEFAKDLLYDLVFSRGVDGTDLALGEVPIIFVVHSMGGLVFKKAYLEARLDARYQHIATSTKAVAFLSTPHRGSDLIIYLKRLLSIAITSNQKQYVSELDENSFLLKDLNDQFRHVAPNLEIFSFFEALKTNIAGMTSAVIVDGNSAKLGYPGEICRSLNTDHQGMSKFNSTSDPNYIAVLGALKSLINSCKIIASDDGGNDIDTLREFLNISDNLEHDIEFFESRRIEGTCRSILQRDEIKAWISAQSPPKLIWLHGRPARGKSVIASFLVRHLQQANKATQFFFFRAGDDSKRIISAFLIRMAFQIAQSVTLFRQALMELAESGWKWHETEWKTIWKRLFENTLLTTHLTSPLFWIIDGVDECSMPIQLVELMSTINQSSVPIQIMLLSRWGDDISAALERSKSKASYLPLCIDKDDTDIRVSIDEELRYTYWGEEITQRVKDEILLNAADNFLWVSLVLGEMKECHTEEDINERLQELPHGMHSLYERMELAILNLKRPSDKSLSNQLLCWVIHSRQTLTMKEMSSILEPEFGRILDLSHTLGRLCGQFITIEADRSIGLVHHTAREYLSQSSLSSSFNAGNSHAQIFKQCISIFLFKGFKAKLSASSATDFKYRATAWWYHLNTSRRSDHADEQLDLLCQFFSGNAFLYWINILASLKQLKVLIDTSQALHSFVKAKRRADAAKDPILRRFDDLEKIESWSKDLLKVLGKFGNYVLQDPAIVYYGLAPFCPTSSQIHKTFAGKSTNGLSVIGLVEEWDDCLARTSVGSECRARIIASSDAHIAIVDMNGRATVWDCTSFEQVSVLNHGEAVSAMAFNDKCDRIVTYGARTTKIWSIRMGAVEESFENLKDIHAVSVAFTDNGEGLILVTNQQDVRKASIGLNNSKWAEEGGHISDGDASSSHSLQAGLQGVFRTAATSLRLSPDGNMVAACYRAYPVTIACISSYKILHKISRPEHSNSNIRVNSFAMDVTWRPDSDEILGIFRDGLIFSFNMTDETYREWPRSTNQDPASIHCSKDGVVYAICNKNGSVELYDYHSCTMIYQLNSDSPINGFSFSGDGRSFYDVRGSYCTIWEPNALIRLSAMEDEPAPSQSLDDGAPKSSVVSEGIADMAAPVVLMECTEQYSMAALANLEGVVDILDISTMEKQHISQTAVRVSPEHLQWNRDGTLLCYSELGRRVTIATIENKKATRFEKFSVNKFTKDIHQTLLLDDDSGVTLLLVASRTGGFLFSLQPVTLKASYDTNLELPTRNWIAHPKSKEYVLSMNMDGLVVHNLSDLQKVSEWKFNHEITTQTERNSVNDATESIHEEVSKIQSTFLQSYVIVEITRQTRMRTLEPRYIIVNVNNVELTSGTLSTLAVSNAVYAKMELPLNIMPNGSLIYLDSAFWVCSWNIKGGQVTRHYFIPRDWLPVQSIGLLQIDPSGSILCPRSGGLSIIKSNIGNSW